MRLSRPCYDKPHRCPGWAGGGTRAARVVRCVSGSLRDGHFYEGRWPWFLRFTYHPPCRTLVLPYVVRHVDPGWWGWKLRDVGDWWVDRRAECRELREEDES